MKIKEFGNSDLGLRNSTKRGLAWVKKIDQTEGMIEGLKIIPLTQHCDDRGRVMEILRKDDPHFAGFGQAYFSSIYPGVVKYEQEGFGLRKNP